MKKNNLIAHWRNALSARSRRLFLTCLGLFVLLPQLLWASVLTGPITVCIGNNTSYTLPAGAGLSYEWTTDGKGTVVTSTTIGAVNEAVINWTESGISYISVIVRNGTTVVETVNLNIDVQPRPRPVITWDVAVGCQLEVPPLEVPEDPAATEITSGVCTKVCEGSTVNYKVPFNSGSTYVWTVSGGTASPSGNTCVVNWGDAGAGALLVTETSAAGCSGARSMCIEIIKKPTADFQIMTDPTAVFPMPVQVCLFDKLIFKDRSLDNGGTELVSWYWDFGDGKTSTERNPSHTYTTPGGYNIKLTVKNACNCTAEYTMHVIVDPSSGVKIICPGLVCENATEKYSVVNTCAVYDWSVIGGTIVSGPPPYSNEITVQWNSVDATGYGYLMLDARSCSVPCPSKTVLKIPVLKSAGTIMGKTIICTNKQYRYTLPQWAATNYNWSITPGAKIIYTDQPNEIVVEGTAPGVVTLNCNYDNNLLLGCSGAASINITLQDPPSIAGSVLMCEGSAGTYSLSTLAAATWTLEGPDGSTTSGPAGSFSHTFLLPGKYRLRAEGPFCWPEPLEIEVAAKPVAPDKITGPAKICAGVPFLFYAADADAASVFVWSLSTGTGTFNTNMGSKVSFTGTGIGPWTIEVHRKSKKAPQCEGPSISKVVVRDYVDPVIRGKDDPCEYSYQYYACDFTNGENYEWTISPATAGSVVADEHTYNPKILWNEKVSSVTLSVVVTKCNTTYAQSKVIDMKNISDISPVVNFDPFYCPGTEVNPYLVGGTDVKGGILSVTDWGDGSEIKGDDPEVRHWYNDEGVSSTKAIKLVILNPGGCRETITMDKSIGLHASPKVACTPTSTRVCVSPSGSPVVLTSTATAGLAPYLFSWKNVETGVTVFPSPAGSATTSIATTTIGRYIYTPMVMDDNGCVGVGRDVSVEVEDCTATGGEGEDPCVPGGSTTVGTTSKKIDARFNMTTGNEFAVDCEGTNEFDISRTGSFASADVWFKEPGVVTSADEVGTEIHFQVPKDRVGRYHFVLQSHYYTSGSVTKICPQYQDFYAVNHLVVKPDWTITCGTGGKYNVTFRSVSDVFEDVATDYLWVVKYKVGGATRLETTAESPATISMDPGTTYEVTLQINTAKGYSCTVMKELVLPALPNASFNVQYTPTCDGTPVLFQTTSTPDPTKLTHFWTFGDGTKNYNPERTYSFDVSSPVRSVTLQVTDRYGCTHTSSPQLVTVVANTLLGTISASPVLACPDEAVTLSYAVGAGGTAPNLFSWLRDEKTRISATTTGSYTMTRPEPGLYWVETRDANRCRGKSGNSAQVDIVGVPDIVINGKADVCLNEEFELNAYASDAVVNYVWERKDPGGSFTVVTDGTGPDYDFTQTLTTAGTYSYRVTINVAKGLSGFCYKTSAVFDVVVHDPPVTPSVNYTMMNCADYELELDASSPSTGVYTWSNGMGGAPVYVHEGGAYMVTLTDPYGCTATAQMDVPKNPADYLWIFPNGCYSLCPMPNFLLNGPVVPFANWAWRRNYSPVASGTGKVNPYSLVNSGVYNLYLDNGLCNATSEDLNFDAVGCSANACSQNLIVNVTSVTYSGGCRATLHLSVTRFGSPVPYTISSSMGGYMMPVSGTNPTMIMVGSGMPMHFEWVAPAGTGFPSGALAEFVITITLPGGATCTTKVQALMNCPSGGALHRTTSGIATEGSDSKLSLAPNPAQQMTRIDYAYAAGTEGARNLVVSDMTGRILANYPLQDVAGQFELHFGEWAPGLYQVVMLQNGQTVQSARLTITR